jgi:hypothetical protein
MNSCKDLKHIPGTAQIYESSSMIAVTWKQGKYNIMLI